MRELRIRFMKKGIFKRPLYFIVVVYKDQPAKTKFIEKLGVYDPNPKKSISFINLERLAYWLNKGATVKYSVGKIIADIY